MLVPTFVAALAALPLTYAQSGSSGAQSDGRAPSGIFFVAAGTGNGTAFYRRPLIAATGTSCSTCWGSNGSLPTGAFSGSGSVLTQTVSGGTTQITSQATSTATRCTTSYGFNSTSSVDTWYNFQPATTSTTKVISTTRDTVTVTPFATTFTDTVTSTAEDVFTSTSTPVASVVPTPAGFAPLLLLDLPVPTASSRIKRGSPALSLSAHTDLDPTIDVDFSHAIHYHSPHYFNANLEKRQTADGNIGGYIAYPNGSFAGLYRRYPRRVDCRVNIVIDETVTSVVTEAADTISVPQGTARAVETLVVTTTTTVVEVAPRPTLYAACQRNNVVKNITDVDGNAMTFDRVIYRDDAGYPLANELVVNTDSDVKCCIACQNTPHCAGSLYAPGNEDEGIAPECHLRLTEPYVPANRNSTPSALPLLSGNGSTPFFATATGTGAIAPIATTTPLSGTCSRGSRSLYLGVIRGQTSFPERFAFSFSNGPCGRYSVSPIPVAGAESKREIAAF